MIFHAIREKFIPEQNMREYRAKADQFCALHYNFTHLQAHSELCQMKDAIFHRMNICVAS